MKKVFVLKINSGNLIYNYKIICAVEITKKVSVASTGKGGKVDFDYGC